MEAPLIATDRLAHVPDKIRSILVEVKQDLTAFYGDRLQKIILFGSYARGDFHDESDIDIMPVLHNEAVVGQSDALSALAYRYMEKYLTKVSIMPMTTARYEKAATFFLMFVQQDGIEL